MKTDPTHSESPAAPALSTYNYNKKRYTGFYLTMLILGTLGATGSLVSLFVIGLIYQFHDTAPLYTLTNIIGAIIEIPVYITAIVLLWLKKKAGLWLLFANYALSIIIAIISLFSVAPYISASADKSVSDATSKGQVMSESSAHIIHTTVAYTSYIGLAFSILGAKYRRTKSPAARDKP